MRIRIYSCMLMREFCRLLALASTDKCRENPSVNQKRDESFVERIVRSVNHCRIGLLAGYTTYRYVLKPVVARRSL